MKINKKIIFIDYRFICIVCTCNYNFKVANFDIALNSDTLKTDPWYVIYNPVFRYLFRV